jgi:hypothetical protein
MPVNYPLKPITSKNARANCCAVCHITEIAMPNQMTSTTSPFRDQSPEMPYCPEKNDFRIVGQPEITQRLDSISVPWHCLCLEGMWLK